jgi:phosphate starvation-inducible PhoH-like protein
LLGEPVHFARSGQGIRGVHKLVTKTLRKDKLSFDDPEALQALVGTNNTRLKLIERTAGAQLHLRGNEIIIEADDAATAVVRSALEQLYGFARKGKHLGSDDVVRAVKVLAADATAELAPIFGDTVLVPRGGRPIAAKGLAQKQYIDLVRGNDICFGVGPAGTGKTYLAMALAVRALLDKSIRRIILTRPAVEAGERLGFLPGTLEEKVDPYLRPLYDALHDMLEPEKVQKMMADDIIEVAPLAFMRGRTLNDAFVILDEAQNTTSEQMKMFLTRLGFGSKAVVTGDITQIDLPNARLSGLVEALKIVRDVEGIGFVYFDDKDVVRHKLVQLIVKAYDAASNGSRSNG